MEITIRPYDKIGDEPFIYSTWIAGYRDSSGVRAVPTPIYHIGQRYRINRILKDATIHVACPPDSPEVILGYIVTRKGNVLDYLYVKGMYRRAGVARRLTEVLDRNAPVFYTHRSADIWVEEKLKTEWINYVYNPYLLEG